MQKHVVGRLAATGLMAVVLLGAAACSDEDGDGAVTDEEIEQLDEGVEDLSETVDEEIDEGVDEVQE